jgi:hypothetical protein
LFCDQRDVVVSKGRDADDENGNVGLTFIKGGALNGKGGGGLASNGIIPLLLVDDDENEKDRLGCCCCCLLFLLFDDEKHRSGACNGGK